MSFIQKSTFGLPVTSSGVGTASFSTVYNGLVYAIHVAPSKAGSTKQKVTITAETTTKSILVAYDPSTAGVWYYPRRAVNKSSGVAVASSHLLASIPLMNERIRVLAACSSGTANRTVNVSIYVA